MGWDETGTQARHTSGERGKARTRRSPHVLLDNKLSVLISPLYTEWHVAFRLPDARNGRVMIATGNTWMYDRHSMRENGTRKGNTGHCTVHGIPTTARKRWTGHDCHRKHTDKRERNRERIWNT
ncbi:unnamed protein product [Ectocarpus sp. 12 AP-2014]